MHLAHGAHLPDVDHLFNAGEGNAYRAIDILETDRLNEAALRRLVRTAIAYNRTMLKRKAAPGPARKPSLPSTPGKKAR